MTTRVVEGTPGSKGGRRERTGVLVVAGVIVTIVVVYLVMNSGVAGNDGSRSLLPYQAVASTLPEADRRQFFALRDALLAAEAERSRTSRWPDASALTLPGTDYRWTRFDRGLVTNYLGLPRDSSQAAWLLEIQEPEPGTAADPAPNDDEHHRLPDGTTLHVYIWTHRFGGQIPAGLVPQPQNSGWTELFSKAPNPVYAIRR